MKSIILEILYKFIPEIKNNQLENIITTPPSKEKADISIPCFHFASILKSSPGEIAVSFAERFEKSELIKVKSVGPYLNLIISDKLLWSKFLEHPLIYHGEKKNLKVMIEYSSPNTNKPQHLGHIRTNLLGMSLSNILSRDGYDVVKCNLCNDRGIAICKSMIAYKYLGGEENPEDLGVKGDHFVGDYYVKYNDLCEKLGKERVEKETSDMLKKWENGDKEVIGLWKTMNDWTLKGWEKTYKKLGCEFDVTYYESDTYMDGKNIVSEGFKKGVFQKKENGAIFADLSKYKLGEKILQRGDGTSLYITQDIGTTLRKFKEFSLDKSVWVVANEQDYHFKSLFAILDLLGYKKISENCYHLSFGYISLPSGKMKSREGTTVDADSLIYELENISKELIVSQDKDIYKKNLEEKVSKISMSALKYFILQYNPSTDFTFNQKSSISFEGRTGPYILYSYARIKSILRKAETQDISIKDVSSLDYLSEQEKDIVKNLLNYGDSITVSSQEYNPSILAKYLYELAQNLNSFYHHSPVLNEKDELIRLSRLYLISKVAEVLKDGLSLLGINTLEEM